MSVPTYGDLGKSARDVFRTGYAYDLSRVKLVVPKSPFGFEFDGSVNLKSYKGAGSFLGKYQTEGYGDVSLKYSFDGPVIGEYSLKNKIAENLDLSAGCSFNPEDASHTCKLGLAFHNARLHGTGSLTKDFDRSPDLFGTVVLKLQNFFIGYQAGLNANSSQITKNDVAVALEDENRAIHFRAIQISKEFGLSGYYKVNEKTEVALDSKVAPGADGARTAWFLGAGLAYKLDEHCKLRLKLDKNFQLGTSLQLSLQENLLLTLAFSLDLANAARGQHKVGLALDIQG